MASFPARAKGPRLAVKLVEAALEVERVDKRGRNTRQNYDYARAEDVAAAATKALLARAVLAELECIEAVEMPTTSSGGGAGLIVKVTCRLIVTDAESGETWARQVIGYGADFPGDKAVYKAMTGARKYAFIHLLGISVGDDPEQATRPSAPEAVKASATRQGSARPLTAKQKGKTNALLGAVDLTKEQASAIRVWWTAKSSAQQFDRISAEQGSALIEALGEDGSGAFDLLNEIRERAGEGDPIARTLMGRMQA